MPPAPWTSGAIDCSTIGPVVIGGTKCPSPTSKWKTRASARRSTSTCSPRRDGEQLALQLRQRLPAPAQVRPRREHAEPGARRVDENPVEIAQLLRQRERVRVEHAHVRRAQPLAVLLQLPRPPQVLLDGDD